MLKVEIVNKIKLPEFTLQSTLEEIADQIIIRDIVDGISAHRAINGGALPSNEPETIKRKGHANQLSDTGELKNSFTYKPSGKSKVIISITSGRKKIAGYLQNDGVATLLHGIKYYRFFGISADAFRRSMAYAASKVKEQIHGNRSSAK